MGFSPRRRRFTKLSMRHPFGLLLSGLVSMVLLTSPVKAAETIYLIYDPLRTSVSIDSLEVFAKSGQINQDIAPYLRGIGEQQRAVLRRTLQQSPGIDPVLLSRFFKTEIGEEILTRLGNIFRVEGGRNGKYALRGALVQAAFEPEGLTALNFLQKLPTNMEVDVRKVLALSNAIGFTIEATEHFTEVIAQLSQEEASRETPVDFNTLADLTEPGPYTFLYQRLNLKDSRRQRSFYVDIYRPQPWRTGKTPVVIFSHGLGSRPEDFRKLATYWASYGYFVALPQHQGSDFQQINDLMGGFSRKVFEPDEFVNRPLDISFLLDELEDLNKGEFAEKLNLEAVAVAGHSLGGYTALSVAGASIDLKNLAQYCNTQTLDGYLNLSLLLQCRALRIPLEKYNFRDERVKVVIAFNPVNSSIFGSMGLGKIEIPVLVKAGSYDPATPAIFEQIRSFPWFKTTDSYLLLVEGQAHLDFSVVDAGITNLFESIAGLNLPPPDLVDRYENATSLAFLEVHLLKNKDYRPYLQASYLAYLSQEQSFKSYLISSFSSRKLERSLRKFRAQVEQRKP